MCRCKCACAGFEDDACSIGFASGRLSSAHAHAHAWGGGGVVTGT